MQRRRHFGAPPPLQLRWPWPHGGTGSHASGCYDIELGAFSDGLWKADRQKHGEQRPG